MALGAGPAHAMYFACYEKLKTVLISQTKYSRVPDTVAYGVAGSVATLFHDAIMCPSEGKWSISSSHISLQRKQVTGKMEKDNIQNLNAQSI